MRDLRHHMKHLKKKVIRETRQAEAALEAREKSWQKQNGEESEFETAKVREEYVIDEKPKHPEARPRKKDVRRFH